MTRVQMVGCFVQMSKRRRGHKYVGLHKCYPHVIPILAQVSAHLLDGRVGAAVQHEPRQGAAGVQALGKRSGAVEASLDNLALRVVPCHRNQCSERTRA